MGLMALAGPLQKLGSAGAHPLFVTLFSGLAASVAAGSFRLYSNKKLQRLSVPLIILSFLYMAAMSAFAFSVAYESPALVSTISRSYIAFGFLFSLFQFPRKHLRTKWLAMILILMGSAFVSLQGVGGNFSLSIGALLAFAYAFIFAVHNFYLQSQKQLDVHSLLFWQNVFTFALAGICLWFISPTEFLTNRQIAYSLLAGLLSSFLGFILYHKSLRHLDFGKAVALRAFSPFLTLLVVLPFFPVTITCQLTLGFSLVIIGHYLFSKSEGKNAKTAN